MKLRPKSKWLVSTIPEAETICRICGETLIYSADGPEPKAHNGRCRESWRKTNAKDRLSKFRKRQAKKRQITLNLGLSI